MKRGRIGLSTDEASRRSAIAIAISFSLTLSPSPSKSSRSCFFDVSLCVCSIWGLWDFGLGFVAVRGLVLVVADVFIIPLYLWFHLASQTEHRRQGPHHIYFLHLPLMTWIFVINGLDQLDKVLLQMTILIIYKI